ncbi:MAG: hypothetical protein DLM58_23700 [Pseudonocardiales bacterium]|nr:MAG: hypothetical protein DLM58_23700 [Pseudonocardiales bacterium]
MSEEFGRYVLQDLLGRGGMGEVYRALDTVRERTVALKLLSKHLGEDESFKVRFRRESRMVAKLNQPHIIPIHDFGEIDGQLFIDMRLVEGDDLGTVLEREGPMAPERAVGVIAQVASALDAAHRAGLVHRDVKPSNVLLTDLSDDLSGDLFAYLVDFGIAFSSVSPATALTATASTVGTVAYMSPERIGGQTSDRSTDIYALACVLYESLTSQKPFDGELLAMMYAHVNTAPPKVTALVPDAPPGLDEVVSKGMAKDSKDRYATAGELARASRAALRGPTTPSPPLPAAHETTLPVRPAPGTTMPLRAGPATPVPLLPPPVGAAIPAPASAGPATPTPPPAYLSGTPTPPPAYTPTPTPPPAYLSGNAFAGAGSRKGTHPRRAMIAALSTLLLVSAVVVAVLVSRHSGPGSSPGQSQGGKPLGQPTVPSGQLSFGESMDFPRNLMSVSYAGYSAAAANIETRLQDGPYRVGPDVSYLPDPDQGTATSTMVNGQQVVDVKINPKAVWDDGTPITADDYVFTWQTKKSADPKTGGCPALVRTFGFDRVESGTVVSKSEARFTFIKGKAFADWKGLLAGGSQSNSPVLNKRLFDKGDPKANCDYLTKGWPVAGGIPPGATNGPWLLLKSNINVAAKTVTLVPNPKYWGAKPKLARLVYVNVGADAATNVHALRSHTVNMIYLLYPPQLNAAADLKKLSDVTTAVNFGPAFEHLDFNTKDPLLSHKEIRQAIAYAIDRPALVADTVGKFSDKATALGNRLLVVNQKGYEDHSGAYAQQDLAKAKSLLEGLGATMGSDGYYTLDGRQLAFQIITTGGNPLRDQTIATIAAQLKRAGIKVTEVSDADIFAGPDKPMSLAARNFQIALFALNGALPLLAPSVSNYQSGGAQNYTQAGDPVADAQLTAMATATSADDAIKAANEADKALWNDMYSLPLYQKPTLLAFDSTYSGVLDNFASAGPLWNSDGIATK